MSRYIQILCVVAIVVAVSEARSIGGWRARAASLIPESRVWMANETGSNNGNDNGAGSLYTL